MSDIVYRLRERASVARCENTGTALGDAVHFEEAADENTRLRAALEEIKALVLSANHSEARYPLARAALAGAEKEGEA